MPSSPAAQRPPSPSSSSSSEFEIQAVTTADGIRKPAAQDIPKSQRLSKQPSTAPNGLVPYGDASSSSSDDESDTAALPTNPVRIKKRVRFSDDAEPTSKRVRTADNRSAMAGRNDVTLSQRVDLQDEQLDEEAAIVAELAHFEAVVADIGRDNDAVTADLLDAEDMREQETQRRLEQRVESLRRRLRGVPTSHLHSGERDHPMNDVRADDSEQSEGDAYLDDIQIKGVLKAKFKANSKL